MPVNKIQFQRGMSLAEFMSAFGTDEQCELAAESIRWPQGFRCPRCQSEHFWRVRRGNRCLLQCTKCRHQASPTAGTMMDSSKLPLTKWFLAMFLISQAKTGLSSLALKRHLDVGYRTAWLMHHKIMQSMAEAEATSAPLSGEVHLDDAYLGGERPGKPGRGSENKVPFIAAVELDQRGHPTRVKMNAVSAFAASVVTQWAKKTLAPGTDVHSDGLNCFAGVIDAGCAHTYVVVGDRKPRDLPKFKWINTVLGNLKTMIKGAHKHFRFSKYSHRYLGAFCYRFNGRIDLRGLASKLFTHVLAAGKAPLRVIRQQAELCA